MNLSYFCITLTFLWTLINSQTVNWINDPYVRISSFFYKIDRFGVIVNQYCGKSCSVSGFIVTQSYGKTNTYTILAITGLNFVNNGASFGIKLNVDSLTDTQYTIKVDVLN